MSHAWYLLLLLTAAADPLRLVVDGPALGPEQDGIVVGDAVRLTVLHTNASDVCLFIDGDRYCSPDSVVEISGLAPGTRFIEATAGDQRAEVVFDVLPVRGPLVGALPVNHVAEPLDLPLMPLKRRLKYCALTNTLERHSQNLIFLRTAASLDRRRWTSAVFAPSTETERAGLGAELGKAFVPVHYVNLDGIDFRDLRTGRAVAMEEKTMALLRSCDVHVFANTYDDPDAAALAALAARYARPGTKRVMELPNLHPPDASIVDAFVAPSHFAAAQTVTSKPVATIYPAALVAPLPRARRRKNVVIVACAGRLAPERSPGLFVRVAARVRRDPRFAPRMHFPGEPPEARPYVRFVVYGEGPLRRPLERLALTLGAGVEFRGHASNLRKELAAVDFLVQPRPRGETFGLANAEASSAGCVVLAYARSGANESCGAHAHLLDTLDPRAYADVLTDLILADRRAPPVLDARFASDKFAARYDRFLAHLLRDLDDAGAVLEPTQTMTVVFSPASTYAAHIISEALANAFDVAIAMSTDRADVVIVSCLDGGCSNSWGAHCVGEALAILDRHPGAASILICGEAWDLAAAGGRFDVVLATAFGDHAYLPVAATAFGELQAYTPEDLLRPSPAGERRGVAYLYYRCRAQREAFVDALRSEGVAVEALGKCQGASLTSDEGDYVPRRFSQKWHDDAIQLYENFKFVVAFENADEPGYVTEKLGLALLAGAVPLYWGPDASHIFDERAYVRCGDISACAKAVKRLDADADAYGAMRHAPKLVKGGLALLQGGTMADTLATLQAKFVLPCSSHD